MPSRGFSSRAKGQGVAIVLSLLPLVERLDSLQLVGTVTGLVELTLITELWATSCCDEKLFERSTPAQYFGHCGRKHLEALLKDGMDVNVEVLGQ